jgi:hypothetical protein
MFTAALFLTAKRVEAAPNSITDEWRNRMWHICLMAPIQLLKKKKKVLIHATI